MSKLVLIVDDDADIRETLGELLENKGYTVAGAANGVQALEFLRNGGVPCVILLDLMMPVMDGYQFREEQLKGFDEIPVVVVTAGATIRSENLRGVAILPKPLQIDKLLAALRRYCEADPT